MSASLTGIAGLRGREGGAACLQQGDLVVDGGAVPTV
jgi:hypothetical protein